MNTAAIFEVPYDRHPLALPTGTVLSLALHIAIAVALTWASWAKHETPQPEVVYEVVQLPKKPEPPKLGEAEKFEPAQPAAAKPANLPIAPTPEPPSAPQAVTPPKEAPPQPLVKKQTPALHLPANSAEKDKAIPVTPEKPSQRAQTEASGVPKPASQSVRDFVLTQIARSWIIDLHSPRFRNVEIGWGFVLRPDGYLEPPFGKNDPWDLKRMVEPKTYALMQEPTEEGRYVTTVVTTFLQAVRQAQPLRVPPNEESYVNRTLPLRFHAGDLVQDAGPGPGG